jgi:hypothetical protein
MFKSPLVLPLTLIFAGVLAFMATTGILPAELLRFWPVVFVALGLVGLVSLSSDELMNDITGSKAKKSAKPAAKSASKPAAKSVKKTAKKTARKR